MIDQRGEPNAEVAADSTQRDADHGRADGGDRGPRTVASSTHRPRALAYVRPACSPATVAVSLIAVTLLSRPDDQDRYSRRARLPAAFEGAPSLC
jgi:hypothetical protein